MGGKSPGAIITDQDAAIGNAIAVVFPNTIHRYCDWHLDRNIGEHMVHLKATHGPDFELYFNRLRNSSSICEAEDCWSQLMSSFKLKEKSWLPKLWERRSSWLPCYLKDKFLAGTRTSQRAESINAFFDTYVHASTPLHEFVVQYDKALASRRKAEEDEDFKSLDSKPVPTLKWPLEEQAGRCYTPALFTIFKQEMKDAQTYWADKVQKEGTVTTYIVGQATKDQSKWRTVSYDSDGVVVSCECKHFESIGLLCRHALCIMWLSHVTEIPDRYILRRWTIESRHRIVCVDKTNNIGDSEVDCDLYWDLHYKCKKALEIAYKSINFADEYNRFLTRKLVEYDNFVEPEGVDMPSQGLISQVDLTALPLSQISSNFISEINIRDPTTSTRHKGRPRLPSRLRSGLEVSQDETAKKKKTCGFCGEKCHYRTGCSKAKENDVACSGESAPGGSQALPKPQ
ncbi:hypothetical protein OROGR_010721 [Orobanche gracilis]